MDRRKNECVGKSIFEPQIAPLAPYNPLSLVQSFLIFRHLLFGLILLHPLLHHLAGIVLIFLVQHLLFILLGYDHFRLFLGLLDDASLPLYDTSFGLANLGHFGRALDLDRLEISVLRLAC